MKRTLLKKLNTVLSAILLAGLVVCASAHTAGAGEGSCSLVINETYKDGPVAGIRLAVTKAASYGEDGTAAATEAYAGSETLKEVLDGTFAEGTDWVSLAEKLAAYSAENGIGGDEVVTGSDGTAELDGLDEGIYLIRQINTEADFEALGYRATVSPYLIALPQVAADGSETRHVTCQPKCTVETDTPDSISISVEKHWVDNSNAFGIRPTEITIALIRSKLPEEGAESGDLIEPEIYEQIQLTAANNWLHTWTGLSTEYYWTVRELVVPPGYTSTSQRSGSDTAVTYSITNTLPGFPTPTPGEGEEEHGGRRTNIEIPTTTPTGEATVTPSSRPGTEPTPSPKPGTKTTPTPTPSPTPTSPGGTTPRVTRTTSSSGSRIDRVKEAVTKTLSVKTGDPLTMFVFGGLAALCLIVIVKALRKRQKKTE